MSHHEPASVVSKSGPVAPGGSTWKTWLEFVLWLVLGSPLILTSAILLAWVLLSRG